MPIKDINDLLQHKTKAEVQEIHARLENESLEAKGFKTLFELEQQHGGKLQPPIIKGLLREGEVMNIVAAPKAGKSWLVGDLLMSFISGTSFLCDEWKCKQGSVILVDNELHEKTIARRLTKIREQKNLDASLGKHLNIISLRGKEAKPLFPPIGKDENFRESIRNDIGLLKEYKPKLIVLDALYKFFPAGMSENDNAAMASFYQQIEELAEFMQAGVICVHHTSKGGQQNKAVTDLGSGGQSQSRSADTHLAIREHAEEDCFVLDAVARSWPQPVRNVVQKMPYISPHNKKGTPEGIFFQLRDDLDPDELKTANFGKSGDRPKTIHEGENRLPHEDIVSSMPINFIPINALSKTMAARNHYSITKADLIISDFMQQYNLYDLETETELNLDGFHVRKTNKGQLQIRRT